MIELFRLVTRLTVSAFAAASAGRFLELAHPISQRLHDTRQLAGAKQNEDQQHDDGKLRQSEIDKQKCGFSLHGVCLYNRGLNGGKALWKALPKALTGLPECLTK